MSTNEATVRGTIGPVAIVGGGWMGAGLATIASRAGYNVSVVDVSPEALETFLQRVRRNYRHLVEAEELNGAAADVALARLRTTTELVDAVAGAGLVWEAVPEELALKRAVLSRVEPLVSESAILATNASHLPTTEIAAAARTPERVVGIHVFEPPFIFRAVEVIKGEQTSDATYEAAIGFVESIGSVPIRVLKAQHGFVINALQEAIRREAAALVAAGVTTPAEIDKAAHYSFGIKYATFGLYRSRDLTARMPLRAGELQGGGLNFDYTPHGADEAYRRRDLSFIEMARTLERVHELYPLE